MQPKTFDPQQALAQLGDDRELLGEIAVLFAEDSERLLGAIESAIDLEDPGALHSSAHALKGTLANFAAQLPRELALELETLGRGGKINGAEAKFEELKRAVESFQEELRLFLAA